MQSKRLIGISVINIVTIVLFFFCLTALDFCIPICHAETFCLKDGTVVKGTISEETKEVYKLTDGLIIDKKGYKLQFSSYYLKKSNIDRKGLFQGIAKDAEIRPFKMPNLLAIFICSLITIMSIILARTSFLFKKSFIRFYAVILFFGCLFYGFAGSWGMPQATGEILYKISFILSQFIIYAGVINIIALLMLASWSRMLTIFTNLIFIVLAVIIDVQWRQLSYISLLTIPVCAFIIWYFLQVPVKSLFYKIK